MSRVRASQVHPDAGDYVALMVTWLWGVAVSFSLHLTPRSRFRLIHGIFSIRRNQAAVTVRVRSGLARAEFALLARRCATSRASDGLYLLESRLRGLHGCR
jgi:hypothetical protein